MDTRATDRILDTGASMRRTFRWNKILKFLPMSRLDAL